MVTSRELLRVRGEREYAVPPLPSQDAVHLFTERAGVDDPAVTELCGRLDNLPLAVELAAARARLLTPTQILERVGRRLDLFRGHRDADPRQQTLRATIEWSYDLLTQDEQRLFARLAVFRGGWTLEAAEEVAEAELETLASLVDKSLVVRQPDRFRMLETIRVYAEERLAASGDADRIRSRHLAYVIGMAEGWYAARLASESTLLPRVDAESDNVRAALDWAHEVDPAQEARLIGAVAQLWGISGRSTEAVERLRAALAQHDRRDPVRARALMHLAEFEDDVPRLEETLGMWRELGDQEGEALALETLGWAHDALGDYASAQRAYEASLELQGRIGLPVAHGLSARAGLCHVLVARGETAAAAGVAADLLAQARREDAVYMEQLALHFLADCPLIDGDWTQAEARYRRALAYAREAGLVGRMTDELLGVAMALAGAGRSADAVRLAAAARRKQAESGKVPDAWWRGMQDRLIGGARARLTDDEREATEREGATRGFDAVVDDLLAAERV